MSNSAGKLPLEKYYPSVTRSAKGGELKRLRKEYTRLRDIAQKRVKRLEASEFKDSFKTSQYAGGFKRLKELDRAGLSREIYRVAKFVNSPTSTISGMKKTRKKTVETLRKHGYVNITEQNLTEFGEFMELVRTREVSRYYDSERASTWYDEIYLAGENEEGPGEMWDEFMEWYEEETVEKRRIAKLLVELGFDV